MEEIKKLIGAFYEIGVSKEVTLEIMHEILDNSSKYANKPDNINKLLTEKLDINQYIAVGSYLIF